MKVRPALLLPLFACALTAAHAAADVVLPEEVFTGLDPILRNAVRQSPRMVSRAIDLEIAENNRVSARAGLLPSVGGYYTFNKARDERQDVPGRLEVDKVYYNVNVTQPVFHWGEKRNNAKIYEIYQQIAHGNYNEAYRGLAQELRQKYLMLIVSRAARDRAVAALAYARQQLALAEDRLAKRAISDRDIHPIRLNAENGEINAERTEYDYQHAKHAFARLAGLSALDDSSIPDVIPALTSQADQVNRHLGTFLAVGANLPTTETVNMRKMLEIETLNLANSRTRLRPKVSFTAGMSQDDQSYTVNIAQRYRLNSQYAGLTVSWTIFDGFAARSAVRNNLARRRQLQNDYEQAVDRISQLAQWQAKSLGFAARLMAISDRALNAAESNLKAKQEEFSRGVATEADVSLTEIALMDARIAAYNARMDYLLKSGDFLGTLNEDPVLANLPAQR